MQRLKSTRSRWTDVLQKLLIFSGLIMIWLFIIATILALLDRLV
jgi:hypothetical protein